MDDYLSNPAIVSHVLLHILSVVAHGSIGKKASKIKMKLIGLPSNVSQCVHQDLILFWNAAAFQNLRRYRLSASSAFPTLRWYGLSASSANPGIIISPRYYERRYSDGDVIRERSLEEREGRPLAGVALNNTPIPARRALRL